MSKVGEARKQFANEMEKDWDYASGFYDNLAVVIKDVCGVSNDDANRAASVFMKHAFDIIINEENKYK